MSTTAIDILTKEFYNTISFKNSVVPDVTSLHAIFYGEGLMINNSFEEPQSYTAESFVQDLESQVALGETQQLLQRELASKTEVFGKVAQRTSIYEYTFADYQPEVMPRGINFIQYVMVGESWHITSMVWNDENENYQIPKEYQMQR
jgi:hypothetical protein